MKSPQPIGDRLTIAQPAEVLERVLEKGIVIDAWLRVSFVGIDLVSVEARVVVASIETYLRHAQTLERAQGLPFTAQPAKPVALPAQPRPGLRKPINAAETSRVFSAALDAWNRHDADRYASLLGGRYVGETHAVPVTLRGRRAARRAMRMKLAVFPDLRFSLEDLVTVGHDSLVSWTATGTHNRRRVRVSGCTVARLHNGRIDQTWCYWDKADMLAPLRVVRDGPHTLHRLATTS
jgi:predicted ester cyclase